MLRRTASLSLCVPALALRWPGQAWAQPAASAEAARPTQPDHPAFARLGGKIEADYPDVKSVVVLRKGQLLFEHQAATSGPETLHDVQSVTKSVLSLAVGAALGQGALRSLDQPVAELVGQADRADPPERTALSPAVTVRHLLTMTAGFAPQERFSRGTADDPAYLLQRERVATPGSTFAYDNLSANLLAIVLEAATGQALSSFAQQAVFQPLGITAFQWDRGSNGHCLGFSGLHLRTRDMARLGELVLGSGRWAGAQLLPESYVRSAVLAQNAGGRPVGLAYGYLWWVVPSAAERRTFLASGWGGQFIWVHPPLDLVIATTASVSADANRRGQALTLIRNELFRAAASSPV